jgi:hypothetical protein
MLPVDARHTWRRAVIAVVVFTIAGRSTHAQAPGSHIVIPFLANDTRPAALEFEGGECDLEARGNAMTCTFQQVFLTVTDAAPDTCVVTTSRYQRTFHHETDGRWVSSQGPEGFCGVLDVATLSDAGGVRWTMDVRKTVTKKNAAECKAVDEPLVRLGWQNIRRPLPCRFVQPGGLSR